MIHGFRGVFVSLVNWEPVFPEFPAGLELEEPVQGLKHSHYPLQGLRLHLWQKGALSPRSSRVLSPSPKSMLSSAYHCQPYSPAEPQAHLQTMALDLQKQDWSRVPPTLQLYKVSLNTFTSESELLSHAQLFATPWTIQSMEFSRPEYWSGEPIPSPGDLPNPGIKPGSPHCRRILYQLSHQGSPIHSKA